MNTDSPSINNAFRSLVQGFAAQAGLSSDAADTAWGVEFEVGSHHCRVLPHPNRDERLMAEVDVVHLGGDGPGLSAATAQLLLRVGAHARFEHDWVIGMDDEHCLFLWTSRDIAATSPGDLEGLLVEGVERAEALAGLLAATPEQAGAASAADGAPSAAQGTELMNSLGSLRG